MIKNENSFERNTRVPSSNWTLGVLACLVAFSVVKYKENINEIGPEKLPVITLQAGEPVSSLQSKIYGTIVSAQKQRRLEEKHHQDAVKWSRMTPHERHVHLELLAVTPEVIEAWEPQHIREDNGWFEENVDYSGGLNIMNGSWNYFGGTDFALTPAQATIQEQIVVGRRIEASVGNYEAPDPNDGTPGW